jgi:hypothetical protein
MKTRKEREIGDGGVFIAGCLAGGGRVCGDDADRRLAGAPCTPRAPARARG